MYIFHPFNNKKEHKVVFVLRNLNTSSQNKQGFVLLFSVLVSSLLLAIGLAIFNIGQKELVLSATARDSQFAFYAADTGIECAFYWDFQSGTFSPGATQGITCSGVLLPNVGGKNYGVEDTFRLDLSPQPYCVDVTVRKTESPRRTYVEARGYNTCDSNNPRRVERAIRATY